MTVSNPGLHHFHLRKDPGSHADNSRLKRLVDKSVYLGGFVVVILTLPQVFKIWNGRSAAGLSLVTWIGYLVGSLFWSFYGVVHKEKPIIFMNILTFILQLSIVVGILRYG